MASSLTLARKHQTRLMRAGIERTSRIIAGFALLSLVPLLVFAYFSVDIASRTGTSGAQARLSDIGGIGAAYVQRQVLGLARPTATTRIT